MKVISFNVNSLRMRQHQMEALLVENADVIGLQETKVHDEQFPVEMVQALGYEPFYHGQKTHYGVAFLVKKNHVAADSGIAKSVFKGFADEAVDHQRRFIGIKVNGVTLLNGYFPQGESRDHSVKFPAKKAFYQRLQALLTSGYSVNEPLVLMGDMNIAPEDQDIGIGEQNALRWLKTGKCSFLPEERAWYQRLFDWGLEDAYRLFYPEDETALSWFDYRSKGFDDHPRRGLRIDHILLSKPLAVRCTGAGILTDLRGMDKPSDHCPVWAEFTQ